MKKGILIGINGNIAVGKTTLCELIRERFHVMFPEYTSFQILPERVDEIDDFMPYSLAVTYLIMTGKKPKWVDEDIFERVQHRFLDLRQENLEYAFEIRNDENLIEDRTIDGDLIFAQSLWQQNAIGIDELRALRKRAEPMINSVKHDLIIYLASYAEAAQIRNAARGREGDRGLPLAHFQSIDGLHENWFITYENSPILQIDFNLFNIVNDEAHQDYILTLIERKLNTQTPERDYRRVLDPTIFLKTFQ